MPLNIHKVFKGILKYVCGNILSPFKHPEGKAERSVVYPLNTSEKSLTLETQIISNNYKLSNTFM